MLHMAPRTKATDAAPRLDAERTAELLRKLAEAVGESRMLKARIESAQHAEEEPALEIGRAHV